MPIIISWLLAELRSEPDRLAPGRKVPNRSDRDSLAPVTKASAKKAPAKKAPGKRKRTRSASALERARSAPMSRYFARACTRARNMIDDPEALIRAADEANTSAANRNVLFAAVFDDFQASIRMVVAYARGNYFNVRPLTLVTVVAGLVYVVSPIDVFPDLNGP